MFRRHLPLALFFLLWSPSLFAITYSERGASSRTQYVHQKYAHTERIDPRMKYLQSRKTNSCTWGHGVCTTNGQTSQNNDGSQVIRYQNTLLEKEIEKQRKLRPWL